MTIDDGKTNRFADARTEDELIHQLVETCTEGIADEDTAERIAGEALKRLKEIRLERVSPTRFANLVCRNCGQVGSFCTITYDSGITLHAKCRTCGVLHPGSWPGSIRAEESV